MLKTELLNKQHAKTNTQIDLNRTRLKEFININIYINVYIPDLKKNKRSDLNQNNPIFFLNHDFFNPGKHNGSVMSNNKEESNNHT